MSNYVIRIRLTHGQFQQLLEQSNRDGQSLEAVAASLIGGSLQRQAAARGRARRTRIDRFARDIGKRPPIDPVLRQRFDLDRLRQLAGIGSTY
jgi:hypothetical protein